MTTMLRTCALAAMVWLAACHSKTTQAPAETNAAQPASTGQAPAGQLQQPASAPAEGCSPCLSLGGAACQDDKACEAIPYWGESLVACATDARGFAANCPWVGCRAAGQKCPSQDELAKSCPKACPGATWGFDQHGCRTCDCGADQRSACMGRK